MKRITHELKVDGRFKHWQESLTYLSTIEFIAIFVQFNVLDNQQVVFPWKAILSSWSPYKYIKLNQSNTAAHETESLDTTLMKHFKYLMVVICRLVIETFIVINLVINIEHIILIIVFFTLWIIRCHFVVKGKVVQIFIVLISRLIIDTSQPSSP